MQPRPCIIGLDETEVTKLKERFGQPLLAFETLPRILVRDGQLWVESTSRFQLLPVSAVVFHGIFEFDLPFMAGLALWGGPCLPAARAMLDCRLKFPCLVRALELSRFSVPRRGYVSSGLEIESPKEEVAKWGDWHCGENKSRVQGTWRAEEPSVLEPFLSGDAVRVVVIGEHTWQIKLQGRDWLKSIHDPTADFMPLDKELADDTRHIAESIGLAVAANDYIVTADGQPHLLEVNHIPNVTRFPEIWEAYADLVLQWLRVI